MTAACICLNIEPELFPDQGCGPVVLGGTAGSMLFAAAAAAENNDDASGHPPQQHQKKCVVAALCGGRAACREQEEQGEDKRSCSSVEPGCTGDIWQGGRGRHSAWKSYTFGLHLPESTSQGNQLKVSPCVFFKWQLS